MNKKLLHSDVTEEIIGAFFKVYNTLGYGFLEKVYENAMLIELRNMGHNAEPQRKIKVYYEKIIVGDYYADIIVNKKVIIELKAVSALVDAHEAQVLNYLKATGMEVGLLLNFGKSAEFKRMIFTKRS